MANNDEIIEDFLKGIDFKNLTTEEISGSNGILKVLTKKILERALNTEMTEHLGYEKNKPGNDKHNNSRNGKTTKTVTSEHGDLPLDVPRDRNSEFEPKIIKKHQRRFEGFDDKILSLYAHGMTTRDIQNHIKEMYDVDVSPELVSQVTNEIMNEVREWQSRPIDTLYPIVFFDAIVVKGRTDGKASNKSVYLAIGINLEGKKEVLGMWIAENEGAKFWMNIITELNNRGLKDILIACIDGLKGFPEAINSVFPNTRIQLCIVHMVRNSVKYVSWKDRKAICTDLKKIYNAPSEKIGMEELEIFSEKWDKKYPSISKSWRTNWNNLNEFFAYPENIRKAIYTTNAIESLNASLRKVVQKRSAFPTDESIFKVLYLSLTKAEKKWTMPIRDWGMALNQFALIFEDRVQL
jgi:transposase-like protein